MTAPTTTGRRAPDDAELQRLRLAIEASGEIIFTTLFYMPDVEALEFADRTIELQSLPPLVANVYDPADGESITFNNLEIGLNLFRTGTYDVYDDGPADRLQKVDIVNWNFGFVRESDITIHSDALTFLEIGGLEGSVTVDAAAGESGEFGHKCRLASVIQEK